jgi:hypothetical protein
MGVRRAFCGTCLVLVVCCSPATAQRPSDADADALIESARQRARQYTQSLPDFECTEVVRRSTAIASHGAQPIPPDKLTIRLRYFEHKEEHKLMLINDRPTDWTFESLRGAIGTGEFGATLSAIFDPASETTFHWESWKTVREHRVAIYTYVIDSEHSRYSLSTNVGGLVHKAVVGYRGELEIDSETGEVLHFTYVAEHLPKALALQSATTTVDYDFAAIGGRDYLLPARSETQMRSLGIFVKNKIEFTGYRKFSSDSSIAFGDGK